MNNPLLILQSLDRHLDHAVELTLYGRGALALGFPARDATNSELAHCGLYLSHLFTEADVFLLPDWLSRRVPITSSFTHLKLLRPATIDLVLTKMMRGADPEDLSDIEFLLQQEPVGEAELRTAFDRVRLPDIQELRDAFRSAQPKVLALAKARERGGPQPG